MQLRFPMPLMSDTLDAFNGTKYISNLDLKLCYWQIEMHPEYREKKHLSLHTTVFTNLMSCRLVLPILALAFSVLWAIYFEDWSTDLL